MILSKNHGYEGWQHHHACAEPEHYEERANYLYRYHHGEAHFRIQAECGRKVDSSFIEVQQLAYAELHQHNPHEKPQEEPAKISVGVSGGANIYELKDIGHGFVV